MGLAYHNIMSYFAHPGITIQSVSGEDTYSTEFHATVQGGSPVKSITFPDNSPLKIITDHQDNPAVQVRKITHSIDLNYNFMRKKC